MKVTGYSQDPYNMHEMLMIVVGYYETNVFNVFLF